MRTKRRTPRAGRGPGIERDGMPIERNVAAGCQLLAQARPRNGEVRGIDPQSSCARNSGLSGDRTCAGAHRHGPAMCGGFRDDLAGLAAQGSETTWPQMLSSLGALFVLGAKPDWGAYDRPYRRRRVALPTYPFQRQRHWLPVASADSARKRTQAAGHPLLGMHVPLAGRPGEHVWSGEISLERCPWIDDHRVQGVAVMPATAYVEMAIAAAVEAVSELPMVLTRIEIEKVLMLQPAIEFEIQTRLEQQDAGIMVFQVHSRRKDTKGDWTLHASGALRAGGIAMPVENV